MESIIQIKNLKKYYKEVKAVDDISFDVKEGELFAFLGLNGAGKSTTISVLVGVTSKDAGEVLVDGESVENAKQSVSRKLGIVFQNSVLDKKLSVYDNLKFRAGLYNLSKEQFKKNLDFLAERLEFKDILKRPFEKLSGGQKRRIDIARALIHEPKILILDEPTTGLDPQTRVLVWKLINELRSKNNLTVLLTTHYMEEAADADNVVIMDSGKIVATGTPIELKNKYSGDYVKLYKYDKKIIEVLNKSGLKFTKNKEYLDIEFENTKKAKEFITKYNDLIDDLEIVKGKMDSVFLNVTGKHLKEEV